MDDDADCGEHVWQLDEVHLAASGTGMGRVCGRCGGVAYDGDEPRQDARRARLD